jgi:hypothetical protein
MEDAYSRIRVEHEDASTEPDGKTEIDAVVLYPELLGPICPHNFRIVRTASSSPFSPERRTRRIGGPPRATASMAQPMVDTPRISGFTLAEPDH